MSEEYPLNPAETTIFLRDRVDKLEAKIKRQSNLLHESIRILSVTNSIISDEIIVAICREEQWPIPKNFNV